MTKSVYWRHAMFILGSYRLNVRARALRPVPIKIKSLIETNQLIMMIYKISDFRHKILGFRIGRRPLRLWGHRHPLMLIYFDDKKKYYGIYICATDGVIEILLPLVRLLDKFKNIKIIDLFSYRWEDIVLCDSKGISTGLKKEHLFGADPRLGDQGLSGCSDDYENLINLESSFGRISIVSETFLKDDFLFTIGDDQIFDLDFDDDEL